MTPSELAERLGLPSADGVWRAARLGQIPHKRLGRRVLFFRDVIERWLADTEHAHTPSPDGAHE